MVATAAPDGTVPQPDGTGPQRRSALGWMLHALSKHLTASIMVGMVLGIVVGWMVNRGLLSGLADADALPAVFHCLWGKDRTGIAAALLLTALGVPQSDVVDDYMLTETFRSQHDVTTALARLSAAWASACDPRGTGTAPTPLKKKRFQAPPSPRPVK